MAVSGAPVSALNVTCRPHAAASPWTGAVVHDAVWLAAPKRARAGHCGRKTRTDCPRYCAESDPWPLDDGHEPMPTGSLQQLCHKHPAQRLNTEKTLTRLGSIEQTLLVVRKTTRRRCGRHQETAPPCWCMVETAGWHRCHASSNCTSNRKEVTVRSRFGEQGQKSRAQRPRELQTEIVRGADCCV